MQHQVKSKPIPVNHVYRRQGRRVSELPVRGRRHNLKPPCTTDFCASGAAVVLLASAAWAKDVPPPMVTCELRWVEAPRQEVNQLFASTNFIVTADQLRQGRT